MHDHKKTGLDIQRFKLHTTPILSEEMTWFSNLIKMDKNKDDKKGKTVCILNIIDNIY